MIVDGFCSGFFFYFNLTLYLQGKCQTRSLEKEFKGKARM